MNLLSMPAHRGASCQQSVRIGTNIPLRKPNTNPTETQTVKDAFEQASNGCPSGDEAGNGESVMTALLQHLDAERSCK